MALTTPTAQSTQSENRKRFWYTLVVVLLLVLTLLSVIGHALVEATKRLGKRLDREIFDPVVTKVIKDEKHFGKYVHKKNFLIFFKEAIAPLGIIAGSFLLWIIYMAITENWSYNPWSIDEGFGSLFFTWDFSKIVQLNVNGSVGLLLNWPTVTHEPTFLISNWCGYLCCLAWLAGGIWYLCVCTGLMGRFIRAEQLRKEAYDKSLDGFNLYDQMKKEANQKTENNG